MKGLMRVFLALIAVSIIITGGAFASDPDTKAVEEQFKKQMPQVDITSVNKTDVEGIYEVVTGNNIIYYAPKSGHLFFGELWNSQGKSLTGQRRAEIQAEMIKGVSAHLDKAVKVGNGKNIVVEFTDPDCPFCRKAYDFFSKRDDITKLVFFFPLEQIHPDARNKVQYVLCAEDKAKAYNDVMMGKFDKKPPILCNDASVEKTLQEHKQIAMSLGIKGTPAFFINGEFVSGANIPKIELLLGKGVK